MSSRTRPAVSVSRSRVGPRCWLMLIAAFYPTGAALAQSERIEHEPICYSTAPVQNAVSRLQQRLDAGETTLDFDAHFGYLPALLRALNVPDASQMLVFSKTSQQRERIAARTPRAVYFNDQNYVGYCQNGAFLEINSVDPQVGSIFYTLDQEKVDKPHFERQSDTCLICHASSQNREIPGQLVRSVFAGADGMPLLHLGGYRTDQTSPLKHRWGGWYVTGTTGRQTHLGNLVVKGKPDATQVEAQAVQNVTNLGRWIRTSDYLTPHSDVVALMVLEHQTEMQNRLTRANNLTRIALFDEAELNKALGEPTTTHSDLTTRRIKSACDPVVETMLFSDETRLTDKVQGTSEFAKEFSGRGPRDGRGRSLRDFDLTTRLFAYPCSYLIYSDSFDGLPAAAKDYVLRRLWDVLTGKDQGKEFAGLSPTDRRAILDLLLSTKKGLPEYWQTPAVN